MSLLADRLPPGFRDMVELSCKATVNGETIYFRQLIPAEVYSNPIARQAVEDSLRQQLMLGLLDKFKPKVHVRR